MAFTSDVGWYCSVVDGTLNLTLNQSLYTVCGLQCKKSRDPSKSRDLFTFSCDIREPSPHNLKTLKYCFENILKYEYSWTMGSITKPARDLFRSRVELPVVIATPDDLQDVVDVVGAKLLDIQPGSPDSVVNSFTLEQYTNSENCWLYTSDTCITGRELFARLTEVGDCVRFVTLFPLPTTSKTTKHITLYFSGADDVYLLQYDVT